MRRGQLSDYFAGVAVKRLSAVETSPTTSNQHEFNGSGPLRRLFGDDDQKNIPARYIWLGREQEAVTTDSILTWYDARRQHPTRTEYRLYYPDNEVTGMMQAGDVLFIALCRDGTAMVIITPVDSTIQNQLVWLFGLEDQPEFEFTVQEIAGTSNPDLDFATRYILDELGIEPEEPEADRLDELIEQFGMVFPTTKNFSEIARSAVTDVDPADDPDGALLDWLDMEEQLFRRLERRIVAERIASGFNAPEGADVDGFLSFSLSVQNRRKSRAGQSLEHHLEAIFVANSIRYARGAETENRNKPDFLFPGQEHYHDPAFPAAKLTMLGAKSTLKDRWRQVLSEAERIENKHLLTLEPGISENQTSEMQAKQLQLVLPRQLHGSFRSAQQTWLMDVSEFLSLVNDRQ
ncbi:type II restriction endonuclease [Qipengyuania sp. SS22]|uniref:type II restriction endonuclease n=1 Tax=Qipengyuania sp. SS22 TaxID=2979461 RepID=UPI0021E605AA|nr:type II restriction endonuclease [Qipengyuania sp. SS22]UYH54617.1 type II restriction endonuclease [Qipengyuania sp. SS22]